MKKIHIINTLLLGLVIIVVSACNSGGKQNKQPVDDGTVARVEVSITGMSCGGCEQTVQIGVAKLEGIKSVKALSAMGKAFVEFSPSVVDTAKIRAAITEAGYVVTGILPVAPAETAK